MEAKRRATVQISLHASAWDSVPFHKRHWPKLPASGVDSPFRYPKKKTINGPPPRHPRPTQPPRHRKKEGKSRGRPPRENPPSVPRVPFFFLGERKGSSNPL